ncbi:MAG: hypothetical protein ACRDR6_07870 [Pseudonocardiaceae bacterium]
MATFLGELAKKLAERWLTLLVVPGMLWVATATTSVILGYDHWADPRRLTDELSRSLSGVRQPAEVGAFVVGVLLSAATASLAAQALGTVIGHLWLAEWPAVLGRVDKRLTEGRRRTWDGTQQKIMKAAAAADRARLALARARLDSSTTEIRNTPLRELEREWECAVRHKDLLVARRDRMCVARPSRPTWISDRITAAQTRIVNEYGLDLAVTWPRLWLTLPDPARTEVTHARETLDRAYTLTGWGLLYFSLGFLWWPASIIGTVTCLTGWWRARSATSDLATIVEAAVDLYGIGLATALSMKTADDRLAVEIGRQITVRFRKGG